MKQLFNNPDSDRGAHEIRLPMHVLYRIVRDRIEYMCMNPRQSIDPDAVCQTVCVEIEKAMGIFPNIK